MSLALPAEHRAIMVVDIAEFTAPNRTVAHQIALQQGLYRMLREAFDESAIPWGACVVEDRGDGAMILIPPEIPKTRLADQLPDRIVAAVRRHNAMSSTEASVQLRVSLHAGEVHRNEDGVISQAVNFAFRILDAAAAKSALKESANMVAFIASDRFYQEVICQDPAADPASYQRIPVNVKNVATEAWLRLRGPAGADAFVLPVLPEAPIESLAGWLDGVNVPNLSLFIRRAAGEGAEIPRSADAWKVFLDLNDVNAGPDGVPPALVFLALLAEHLGGEFEINVSEWVRKEARRLRLEPKLTDRLRTVAAIPVKPRLHILIAFEPHGIVRDRYRLSVWRQDDPRIWPPARVDGGQADLAELESRVDELVLAAEAAWHERRATILLEFLVPRALIHLPVHRFRKELALGNERPLSLEYPIVLRSLERMSARHWHRVWHDRWRSLQMDPSVTRIHFGHPADSGEPYRVDALLSDPRWVSMVLSRPPRPQPSAPPGTDDYLALLQRGLPAAIWHPDASPEELRQVLTEILRGCGLIDLPDRTQAARRDAYLATVDPAIINIYRGLVVLWDDAERRVILDGFGTSTATAEESADER